MFEHVEMLLASVVLSLLFLRAAATVKYLNWRCFCFTIKYIYISSLCIHIYKHTYYVRMVQRTFSCRSYLCRAKMLLLLLIPCLYWERIWDGWFWFCFCFGCYSYWYCCFMLPSVVATLMPYYNCCCCCCAALCVQLTVLCVSSAKCSFHRLAQRWVGVRFFSYIITTTTYFASVFHVVHQFTKAKRKKKLYVYNRKMDLIWHIKLSRHR